MAKKKTTGKKPLAAVSRAEDLKLNVFKMVGGGLATEYIFALVVKEEAEHLIIRDPLRGLATLVNEQGVVQGNGGPQVGTVTRERWTWLIDDHMTDHLSKLNKANIQQWRTVTKDEPIYAQYTSAIDNHRTRQAEQEAMKAIQEKKKQKLEELENVDGEI